MVDLFLVSIVLVYGLITHAVDPITEINYTFMVLLPFWIGWTIAGVLGGVYGRRARESLLWSVGLTAPAWVVAALVGSAIRATTLFPGGAPWIFVLVTIGVGLPILVIGRIVTWRIIAISYESNSCI